MKDYIFFFILNSQFFWTFATPPTNTPELLANKAADVAAITDEINAKTYGYECGNIFFTDAEINEVLALGLEFADKNFHHPQRYHGPLYSDARTTEYLIWPIKKNAQILPDNESFKTYYHIVYTRNSEEVVDVIARITITDYTKCTRRDGLQTQPSTSTLISDTNGYQCGHKFFNDERVRVLLGIAQEGFRQKAKFLTPYFGLLYPQNSGNLIWPIMGSKKLFETGQGYAGLYYLVLSKEGEFIETLVKGFRNNYFRCTRSRLTTESPVSDPLSNLLASPLRSGYQCGKSFFDKEVLADAVRIARDIGPHKNLERYPAKYNGAPFYEPCLLWPIYNDGNLYKKGTAGPYRLVLTEDYQFMCLAIIENDRIKVCDTKVIKGEKNHDTSDYLCALRKFSHQHLVIVADVACEKMSHSRKRFFPARYEGPRFEKDGPYFTFPIYLDDVFRRKTGPDRVVINSNCEVVGALTTFKSKFGRRLIKCHRKDDGPLPHKFFQLQTEPISEYRIDY